MGVLEHQLEPRRPRDVPLRSHAADHGSRERRLLVGRQDRPAWQHTPQHVAHHPVIVDHFRAVVAPLEVRSDRDLLRHRELTVAKGGEATSRGSTGQGLHTTLNSLSSIRSACRARVSRDLTVPTATPKENAISS